MPTKILLPFTLLLAIVAIVSRIFPHAPNFTPLGALSLFVGAHLLRSTKWALLIPFGIMFLSDLFIGFYDLKLMAVVYGSFLVYALLGRIISEKKNIFTLFLSSFGGALFFFLSTNFAVWLFSEWYPRTIEGLISSYIFAIPFFKYMLLGDFAYVSIFFGAHALVERYVVGYMKGKNTRIIFEYGTTTDSAQGKGR